RYPPRARCGVVPRAGPATDRGALALVPPGRLQETGAACSRATAAAGSAPDETYYLSRPASAGSGDGAAGRWGPGRVRQRPMRDAVCDGAPSPSCKTNDDRLRASVSGKITLWRTTPAPRTIVRFATRAERPRGRSPCRRI